MKFLKPLASGANCGRVSLALIIALPMLLPMPASAEYPGRTEQGRISVAHLADLIARAAGDPAARERLSFYLTSVGESTGHLLALAENAGPAVQCNIPFSVGNDTAWTAIVSHVPDRALWSNTAATPIIVDDILKRAGCR